MATVLKWPANKWEKAPLLCRLFGHKWDSGWWGSYPYTTISNHLPVDNLGEAHLGLMCECDRCGNKHTVVRVHASTVLKKVKNLQDRHIYLRKWRVKDLEE